MSADRANKMLGLGQKKRLYFGRRKPVAFELVFPTVKERKG